MGTRSLFAGLDIPFGTPSLCWPAPLAHGQKQRRTSRYVVPEPRADGLDGLDELHLHINNIEVWRAELYLVSEYLNVEVGCKHLVIL